MDNKAATMTSDERKAFIATLRPDMVREVYSGKQGCMCGCRGKYWTHPVHKEEADAERGYATDSGSRDLAMVKRVLKLIQAEPKVRVDATDAFGTIIGTPYDAERNYTIYLCKSASI